MTSSRVKKLNMRMTAYCGLCCADCIPSRRELFVLLDRLEALLRQVQFERYAELKAARDPEFNKYPRFLAMLRKLKTLRCPAPCRDGGGNPSCEVKRCARNHGLDGCWQCARRRRCAFLDPLRRAHPNLDYHLALIARMGPAEWFHKRREHYSWQQKAKGKTAVISAAESRHGRRGPGALLSASSLSAPTRQRQVRQ